MIRVKRVYEEPEDADGVRVLVDGVWPRGMTKQQADVDDWQKDVAPSKELRKWFGHDPDKWPEFKKRYFAELDERPDAWKPLLEDAREDDVTLVFSAKDEEHNNAVALAEYLRRRAPKGAKAKKRSKG